MNYTQSKSRKWKKVLIFILILLLILGIFSTVYLSTYYKASDSFIETINPSLTLQDEKEYIALSPKETTPTLGYIFYPGAKVDHVAYLPMLASIAEEGYFTAVIKPTFHLAILSTNVASTIQQAHPEIQTWVVGGHSLGGVAAAQFANENLDTVQGIIFLASYPAIDLSHSSLNVLSITATNDEVLNWANYTDSQVRLPGSRQFVSIEGGNHAQFGLYGPQKGDGKPTITAEKQQALTIKYSVQFLYTLANFQN